MVGITKSKSCVPAGFLSYCYHYIFFLISPRFYVTIVSIRRHGAWDVTIALRALIMEKRKNSHMRPMNDGMYHSNNHENILTKFTCGNTVTGSVSLIGLYFFVHLAGIVINKISSIGVGL